MVTVSVRRAKLIIMCEKGGYSIYTVCNPAVILNMDYI